MATYLNTVPEADFFWHVLCYEKDGTLAFGKHVQRRINGQLREVREGIVCDLDNVSKHMEGAYAWLHEEPGRVVKFRGKRVSTEVMFDNYADVCATRGLKLDGYTKDVGTDQDLIDKPVPWDKS